MVSLISTMFLLIALVKVCLQFYVPGVFLRVHISTRNLHIVEELFLLQYDRT